MDGSGDPLPMGAECRKAKRPCQEGALFGTLGSAALTVAFLAVMLGPVALALYALKSLAGIE